MVCLLVVRKELVNNQSCLNLCQLRTIDHVVGDLFGQCIYVEGQHESEHHQRQSGESIARGSA